MNWCFAIINNKLAEIYFEKSRGKIKFIGHCYVKKKEYSSKKEKKWIRIDTIKVKLVYRDREYKRVQLPSNQAFT